MTKSKVNESKKRGKECDILSADNTFKDHEAIT